MSTDNPAVKVPDEYADEYAFYEYTTEAGYRFLKVDETIEVYDETWDIMEKKWVAVGSYSVGECVQDVFSHRISPYRRKILEYKGLVVPPEFEKEMRRIVELEGTLNTIWQKSLEPRNSCMKALLATKGDAKKAIELLIWFRSMRDKEKGENK